MKNNRTEIFFSPRVRGIRETAFFNSLKQSNADLIHIKKNYRLNENYLNYFLNKKEILDALDRDLLLPIKAKSRCKKKISELPKNFLVADRISRISIDFTIKRGKEIYFIEFNEPQHRSLPNNSVRFIYSPKFEKYKMPRCVQRLARDVWRWQNLPNYQIIWYDWFEANPNKKVNLFSKGKNEFSVPGKFSFQKFLNGEKFIKPS